MHISFTKFGNILAIIYIYIYIYPHTPGPKNFFLPRETGRGSQQCSNIFKVLLGENVKYPLKISCRNESTGKIKHIFK